MKRAAVIILVVLGSCMEQTNIEHETASLLATDKEFAETSLQKGSAQAFRIYLAEDAYQFPQGGHPIQGGENIYNSMIGSEEDYILEWEPKLAEVSLSADMGWSWGEYKLRSRQNPDSVKSFGKYMNVWKKDADGNWKVIADIGNKSPAPDPLTR